MQSISVRHNIEVAHRLFETPGKCENIHGHSMWITMTLEGNVNKAGMVAGLDFGAVKKSFRSYLDVTYDHRLLLNADDPWAQHIGDCNCYPEQGGTLPGLRTTIEDPTTENIAKWVGQKMRHEFNLMEAGVSCLEVEVWETSVNKATWRSDW